MGKNTLLIFLSIILLSIFLRFYKLTQIPSGFFFDEVTAAVNGSFLAQNLHDEFGNFLPDFISIGADYRHATIFYATAVFIKIFGLGEFAVRSATATFGVLIVVLTYCLAFILTKDKKISLVATALTAISPWLLNLSRSSNEVTLALFFLMAADTLMLLAISKDRKIYFVFAYLLLLLTWYSYSGAILLSILHLAFLLIYGLVTKSTKGAKISLAVVFISFLLFPNFFYYIFQPKKITGRFDQISVFSEKGTQLVLEEQIREDGSKNPPPYLLTRIFHNKPVTYFSVFANNYATYFSGQYLLGSAALPIRYKVLNTGLLYYLDVPFLLLGAYFVFRKLTAQKALILFWLLAAPIPAALTLEDTPNMQRAIFMVPALQMIIATGLVESVARINLLVKIKNFKLFAALALFIVYAYSLGYFLHQFFIHQPRHQNWYRNGEWKEAATTIDRLSSNYKAIKVTNPLAHYYLMFYSPSYRTINGQDPNYVKNRNIDATWSLGKYTFIKQDCFFPSLDDVALDTLYVVGQNCKNIPSWARKLGEAKTSDGVTMLTFLDAPLTPKELQDLKAKSHGI